MYAQISPVEVRALDKEICAQHVVKTCYTACPWGLYPVAFRDSSACGLCLECLRTCPQDNLALNLRPFGSDLGTLKASYHLDETFLALVMLGSVMTFSAVFTGPWGWLKSAALDIGSLQWAIYVAGYLLLNLAILPISFGAIIWAGRKFSRDMHQLKQTISIQAQALIPLGLMAWMAFTVSFAFSKLNFVLGVLNDPFGWGWHWLGIINTSQSIALARLAVMIQIILLIAGMFWSARVIKNLSASKGSQVPNPNILALVFNLAFTLIMLWLLVG